jgi:hypothetical protein
MTTKTIQAATIKEAITAYGEQVGMEYQEALEHVSTSQTASEVVMMMCFAILNN